MNSIKKIQDFWKKQAVRFRTSPDASWGDLLMKREVKVISGHLKDGDVVLDAGCANGSSSVRYVTVKHITLLGIDYIPQMITYAENARTQLPKQAAARIGFKTGNVLSLRLKDNLYDVIISTRCICNLTSWSDQRKALLEFYRVLRPGGVLLLSEPVIQGLERLNAVGKSYGLKPLSAPWHNLYVDENRLLSFSRKRFQVSIDNFSSSYYFLSRILYRKLMGDDASRLKRDSWFNSVGILLPSIGDIGVQRLYVMKKLQ
jgi:ubiquinone/menaquinone biosynthesis C-methylase UbiE